MVWNLSVWGRNKAGVRRRWIQGAVICGLAIAVNPCATMFAQTGPGSDGGQWWSMWNGLDPEPRYVFDADGRSGGEPAFERGPQRSSIVTLHELQHHVPGRAMRDYERALKARRKSKNEEAATYFNKAIQADPEFTAAINDLGTLYLESDKVDFAIERFDRAIAVDAHASPPYSNLALAYLRQGRYADAERLARHAVDLDRGSRDSSLVLGISLVVNGSFTAEAQHILTNAAGQSAKAKLWLAIGQIQIGDTGNAKDQLKMYLAQADQAGLKVALSLLQQIESLGPKK